MNKLIKLSLSLAICFSSFSVWFAPHTYCRLPMFFIGIAIISALVSYPESLTHKQADTAPSRNVFSVYFILVILSFIINLFTNGTPKTISNGIGTIVIYLVFFYLYASLIDYWLKANMMIKCLGMGGLVLMGVILIDGCLVNFANIKIHDWFVFAQESNTDYFYRGWISGAAPTAEPGESSACLNILAPFSILYFKKFRIIIATLYVFCLFSLLSSTGFVSAICGSLLLLIISKLNLIKKLAIVIGFITVSSILLNFMKMDGISELLDNMAFTQKISMSGETASDSDRRKGFEYAYNDMLDAPIIGQGPGYGKTRLQTGYLSTYLANMAMYGIAAGCLFIVFWFIHFRKCFKMNESVKYYFIFAFLSTFIIGLVIDTLHIFIYYMLFPLVNKLYNYRKYSLKDLKRLDI